MISASDSELAGIASALKQEGNAAANEFFGELVQSHQIYVKNMAGSPDANRQRAQLKDNFRHYIDTVEPAEPQRVLIKLGDLHLYKGINPLHQRDLGNYIAEFCGWTEEYVT